jgi:pSer/pThr/pTyr-binding forkhead associated (FHA) protein
VLAKLIETGTADRKQIPVTREEFLIGRGSDCDLRLGSSEVSRHHCLLRLRGEEALVIDLGSSNGTYLNGHRVRSQAALQSGDELRVASFRFVLELDRREGITWYSEPGVDPNANTFKLKDAKRRLADGGGEEARDRPPGEAGGQGDSTGKESG